MALITLNQLLGGKLSTVVHVPDRSRRGSSKSTPRLALQRIAGALVDRVFRRSFARATMLTPELKMK